jgi:hypothetical protein
MTPQTVYIKSGFTMVPNKVLLDTALSAMALRLFEVLENHSGEHRTCWPGYPLLAIEVGCSVKWLPSVIKKLVEAGYLHVQYRQGKTNIYTLLLRVERQVRAPIPATAPLPMQSTDYEQKQQPKTNIKGVQPPFPNQNNRATRRLEAKKGPVDFNKYLPGGKYEASVIS